jgi:RNA polymerase sigma-70 factor (ECF subfamily)
MHARWAVHHRDAHAKGITVAPVWLGGRPGEGLMAPGPARVGRNHATASHWRIEMSQHAEAALTSETAGDRALVAALRRRAPEAVDRLLATYADGAYRLAIGLTRNGLDAEEAVRDALGSVMRTIDTFPGEPPSRSWLYRLVIDAASRTRGGRSGRRLEIPLAEVLPPFHQDGRHAGPMADWAARADDPDRGTELRLVLSAAIDALPADYRSVLVLRDVEGLSSAEVAQVVSATVADVRSRVHLARLFLRARLALHMSAST